MHIFKGEHLLGTDVGPLVRGMGDFGLSEEEPDVKDVLQQLDRACRDIGFFYVVCIHTLLSL